MSLATKLIEEFFSGIISQLKSKDENVDIENIENQKKVFLSIVNDFEDGIKVGQKLKNGWVRYELTDDYLFDFVSFIPLFAGLRARKKSLSGKKYLEIKIPTPKI